ncbi:hypothetical protein MTR_6g008483 [Medicago truncatula]|uniref:Transmembrane protein n=1 Tax=Medicago truncatula TaxID=3880 RepID=A0A072U6F1_MEDTR|nr:hypothetical protein MTR_6g008483 [Medicago truncatula]
MKIAALLGLLPPLGLFFLFSKIDHAQVEVEDHVWYSTFKRTIKVFLTPDNKLDELKIQLKRYFVHLGENQRSSHHIFNNNIHTSSSLETLTKSTNDDNNNSINDHNNNSLNDNNNYNNSIYNNDNNTINDNDDKFSINNNDNNNIEIDPRKLRTKFQKCWKKNYSLKRLPARLSVQIPVATVTARLPARLQRMHSSDSN